jgi:hypothetical protein
VTFSDPERDGLALLEAQRRLPYSPDEPACFVGGFAELTTVSAAGITQKRLRTWPDRIGEKISLAEAA